MKPSLVSDTRLSGSVKLRCALAAGSPRRLRRVPGPCGPRPSLLLACSARAFALGGGLGFPFQRRLRLAVLASRRSLSATQSGSSSPRFRRKAHPLPRPPPPPRPASAPPRLAIPLPPLHALVAIALCLEAVALIFVPSSATYELHQARRLRQSQHLHKQPGQRSQVPIPEAEMGRQSGGSPPTISMKSTRSMRA